jgi:uncharacterized protein (TIGR02145 family)
MKKRLLIQSLCSICFIIILSFGCKRYESENAFPVLTTDTIIVLTEKTAIVYSKIVSPGDAQINSFGVCWSTDSLPTINDNKSDDSIIVSSFSSIINGLKNNTKYYVRSYATNAFGTSYGDVKTFTTLKSFPINGSTVKDLDINVYHTIVIGNQVWLMENLRTSKYSNGDPITNFTDMTKWAWGNLNTGAFSGYTNDINISNIYGNLYNWFAVNDKRGLCPGGWHVATSQEMDELIKYLGGNEIAGGKMKEVGTSHWLSPNTGATNESGFTLLSAGFREIDGTFQAIGHTTYLWTSSNPWPTSNQATSYGFGWEQMSTYPMSCDRRAGLSVRCIMDK